MSMVDGRWRPDDLAELPVSRGFRLRGTQMTRLETFTDAAFAFAVTLLVISVDDVPQTYAEFVEALKSVPAFVACFLQLIMFWLGHRRWSELYGLDDLMSVWLSFLLIMGVLVLVYPLRAMYSLAFSFISDGWLPAPFALDYGGVASIFIIYGIAFAFLCAVVVGLYLHAYQKRERLGLSALEAFETRHHAFEWSLLCATGLISAALAFVLEGEWIPLAGWLYAGLGIAMPLAARKGNIGRRKVMAA